MNIYSIYELNSKECNEIKEYFKLNKNSTLLLTPTYSSEPHVDVYRLNSKMKGNEYSYELILFQITLNSQHKKSDHLVKEQINEICQKFKKFNI